MFLPKKIFAISNISQEYTTIVSSHSINGNNSAIILPIFRITGSIYMRYLMGIVTTTLGTNQTAASFRLNDQTATVALTAVAGTTVSNSTSGSFIYKRLVTSSAVSLAGSSGVVPGTLPPIVGALSIMTNGVISSKTGANTDIEYLYTTTETPTTGAIDFYLTYKILDPTTTVVAV